MKSAYPLGAQWDERGTHFSVYSADAEKMQLCLFVGDKEYRHWLEPDSQGIWSIYIPHVHPGSQYGYRAYGPFEPEQGLRFNHHKLLLDPYAYQLSEPLHLHPSHFAYRLDSVEKDLSFDHQDSAPYTPKCVVVDRRFQWHSENRQRHTWSETVIYEAHLKGFTQQHPDITTEQAGRYMSWTHPAITNHLKRLGVTSVEFLPIHTFASESFLIEKGLSNYWGYNSALFFAPDPRYRQRNGVTECKAMIDGLHQAGFEVILDVVYNHTCEGNELGPTVSMKGLDNRSYYRLLPDQPRYYINDTGCGNTIQADHPQVEQLILDSLRYWAVDYRVDGFRFDLAPILGRNSQGFRSHEGFYQQLVTDPVLSQCKQIVEPWDIGPGGYQLGHFPPTVAEWNDQARDAIRQFWRRDNHSLPRLGDVLLGSYSHFHDKASPQQSINMVTCHDGFTLWDLVSHNHRHNQANLEQNHDGHGENYSHNHGHEGPSDDPEITAQRYQQMRNRLATVFLAQGTPMLLAGDEWANSQQGNNNAYCQDNELSWVNWCHNNQQKQLIAFTARLIALRKHYGVLRQCHFLHGHGRDKNTGFADIHWLHPRGGEMNTRRWHASHGGCLGLLLAHPEEDTLLLLFNNGPKRRRFSLPDFRWNLLLSTHQITDEACPQGIENSWLIPTNSLSVLTIAPF